MTAPAWPRPPGRRPACRYRATATQWAALPHVPLSSIEPGDLLIYNGEGHVAIYVGGGYIIDAPQTGMNVQKIPESTPWYAITSTECCARSLVAWTMAGGRDGTLT
jgi:Cell wall-associated hydrolases (invasion-associated proteins)